VTADLGSNGSITLRVLEGYRDGEAVSADAGARRLSLWFC